MSLFIKDLYLPETNGEYMYIRIHHDGTVDCDYQRYYVANNPIDIAATTAIEISKEHGRLIDADKLLEDAMKNPFVKETYIPTEAVRQAETIIGPENIRICEHCGRPLNGLEGGMTTDDGDFYCHEDCFAEYMDKTYGKHQWMEVNDDGCNGYYMYYDPDKDSTFATGIYYTNWEDE